jgi:hypothetical protein
MDTTKSLRTLHVRGTKANLPDGDVEAALAARVAVYLPSNYEVVKVATNVNDLGDWLVIVNGYDAAGWTAEGYVQPRLASGLLAAEIVR